MKKERAIELLGGSTQSAADAIGITFQAVDKWPDELPPRIEDRVIAAIARKRLPELVGCDLRQPKCKPKKVPA